MIHDPDELVIDIDYEIFNEIYIPELENNARTQIAFGGSSSGKSYFYVAQRVLIDILKGGRNYLICRKVMKDIRDSVFSEIIATMENWDIKNEFRINQTSMQITCKANGYTILFRGLDDVSKLKSITVNKGVITDILIEEATEATADDLKQLNKRLRGVDAWTPEEGNLPKRMTLLFNPILKTHPIYKEYFAPIMWEEGQTRYESEELTIIKTTYKNNDFLTDADRADLENETDPYYYQVYTLGEWGILGDVIFPPRSIDNKGRPMGVWEVQDLTDLIPSFDNLHHGQDFGFSADPAAYIKTHYDKKKKTIYVIKEFYKTGLSDEALFDAIEEDVEQDYLMCDSAEPKSINKLKTLGINARAVKKGKDSVRYGIRWIQSHIVIIHKDCIRFKQEIEVQQWKKDKHGEAMAIPLGKNDHGIDALRYQYEDEMAESVKTKFVKVKGL